MKAKYDFTEGPWENKKDGRVNAMPCNKDYGAEEFAVAKAFKTYYGVKKDVPIKEWRANAALVAASPDMLEALVRAESVMFHINADGGIDTPIDEKELRQTLQHVRRVIKRALGKGGDQ